MHLYIIYIIYCILFNLFDFYDPKFFKYISCMKIKFLTETVYNGEHSLFDDFDVHEMVSVIANG